MRIISKTNMTENNMNRAIVLSLFVCFLLLTFRQRQPTYQRMTTVFCLLKTARLILLQTRHTRLGCHQKMGLLPVHWLSRWYLKNWYVTSKRAKSAASWSMVAAALSSASEGMAQSQMNQGYNKGWAMQNYVNARENTNASLAASADARAQAEDLKTLLLDLVVRNNSQKEMIITDMDRGLVWFVLPNCEVRLPLLKDEECHFRISSCNPMDENVKYINALGTSTLEKYTIGLETDVSWYVPISNKALKGLRFETEQEDGYIRIVKETMAMSVVSEEEFRTIKANQE